MRFTATIAIAIAQLVAGAALAAGGTAADGSYATTVQSAPAASVSGGLFNTALGLNSRATGNYSFAGGYGATAGSNAVVIGNNDGLGSQSVVIGDQNSTNASQYVTVIGQQQVISAGLQDSIQIGNIGGTQASGTVGVGTSTYFSSAALFGVGVGGGANVNAENGVAVGMSAKVSASATNSVALGANSTATRANSVEVGGRQVTGVAAGTQANDAVNYNQLQTAIAAISPVGLDDLRNRIGALENKVGDVERKAAAGTAIALAMQNGGVSLAPGESAIGAGIGGYDGEGAVAITFAHSIVLDRQHEQDEGWIKEAVLSAGVGSASAGGVGVRLGISFKF